jgi:L-lactate dehydrogenase complex protein LldE
MKPVQFVPTCVVGELHPEVGHAAVALLRALDFDVHVPRSVLCCGQPALNAGFRDEAARVMTHDVAGLAHTEGPIVLPSGSCAHAITHGWKTLSDDPAVAAIGARAHELSSFLVAHGALERLRFKLDARVAYHPSCHTLRGMGIDDAPRQLLAAIDGVEVVPLPNAEECCGFGGTFAVDREPISIAMMNRKLDAADASTADIVTACDQSCLMHLQAGSKRRGAGPRFAHLAVLLAEALA